MYTTFVHMMKASWKRKCINQSTCSYQCLHLESVWKSQCSIHIYAAVFATSLAPLFPQRCIRTSQWVFWEWPKPGDISCNGPYPKPHCSTSSTSGSWAFGRHPTIGTWTQFTFWQWKYSHMTQLHRGGTTPKPCTSACSENRLMKSL